MKSALLRKYFEEIGLISIRPHKADKYFIPPKDKTVAIFLYPEYYHTVRRPVALFGDSELGEKLLYGHRKLWEKFGLELECADRNVVDRFVDKFIFSKSLEPKKVFKGRKWLEKIIDAYEVALKQAKEENKEKVYQRSGSIVFLTTDEGYIRGFDVGEDTIYDDVTESDLLKEYFDELGLTKKLLGGRQLISRPKRNKLGFCVSEYDAPQPTRYKLVLNTGEYYAPQAGETAAILLCRRVHDVNTPVALFGDKELTEKIIGISLKPKMVFEDRNLLKKIAGTYRDALKEAEENHFKRDHINHAGEIFFVTPTEGYARTIGIDEKTVHNEYMESEQIKKYFDELGLTKELLAGEPNKEN
jgi:hypothetical protein